MQRRRAAQKRDQLVALGQQDSGHNVGQAAGQELHEFVRRTADSQDLERHQNLGLKKRISDCEWTSKPKY